MLLAPYLTGRAGSSDMVEAWQAGYAPPGWTQLADHLHAAGYTDTELLDAGLALTTRRGSIVDRFRDRLILPTHDTDGRPVGFVGRAAPGAAPDVPRYLNSPDSVLYHKGELLLGLHTGRALLEAGAVPVLVEGAFDAMAVTAAGQGRHVGVAPSGTALTPSQVRQLDQAVPLAERGVIVAFDGDPAGRAAAAAAFPTLAVTGAWPGHATLPDGTDPAGLKGAELRQALDHAAERPLAHLAIGQAIWPHRDDLDSPGGRQAAVHDVLQKLIAAADRQRVEKLLAGVASLTNTDIAQVRALLDRQRGSDSPRYGSSLDRRENLDHSQQTGQLASAQRARPAFPVGLAKVLGAPQPVTGKNKPAPSTPSRPRSGR